MSDVEPAQVPGEDVPEMPEGYMEEYGTHVPEDELLSSEYE